jgi:hypothetical protein
MEQINNKIAHINEHMRRKFALCVSTTLKIQIWDKLREPVNDIVSGQFGNSIKKQIYETN